MSPGVRDEVRKLDGDKQYADKAMDWVERHPVATNMIGGSGLLADEGMASARALKHLAKTDGIKAMLNSTPRLAKAFGTYGGLVGGTSMLTAGIGNQIAKKHKKKQDLK